jgi:hypothetical protein
MQMDQDLRPCVWKHSEPVMRADPEAATSAGAWLGPLEVYRQGNSISY